MVSGMIARLGVVCRIGGVGGELLGLSGAGGFVCRLGFVVGSVC